MLLFEIYKSSSIKRTMGMLYRTSETLLKAFAKLDLFQSLLCLKKLMIFEQIYRQILRAYVSIWSKNLSMKLPKRAILASKWSFERGLLNSLSNCCLMRLSAVFQLPLSSSTKDVSNCAEWLPKFSDESLLIGGKFSSIRKKNELTHYCAFENQTRVQGLFHFFFFSLNLGSTQEPIPSLNSPLNCATNVAVNYGEGRSIIFSQL
jgi:hypothetical protein